MRRAPSLFLRTPICTTLTLALAQGPSICLQYLFVFSQDIWDRACEQAEERKKQQEEGKGKGKRRSVESMSTDIYTRTVKSRFDVAMGGQFGGTVWQS